RLAPYAGEGFGSQQTPTSGRSPSASPWGRIFGVVRPPFVFCRAGPPAFARIAFLGSGPAGVCAKYRSAPSLPPPLSSRQTLPADSAEIANFTGPQGALVEFGSGSTRKVRILLAAAPLLAAYVPVDISSEMLAQEAAELRRDYPQLAVIPVEADFTQPFRLPHAIMKLPRTGFFPGSTIGNFEPHDAAAFLRHAGRMLGRNATLIIGVD